MRGKTTDISLPAEDSENSAGSLSRNGRQGALVGTFLVVLLAFFVRLAFFNGYQGHDDRSYITYAWILSDRGYVPLDDPTQWLGRIGFWVPMAASLCWLGLNNYSIVIFSLLCSLGSVYLAVELGAMIFSRRCGLLAGILIAFLPLEVILSTYAYADAPMGFFVSLTLFLFLKGEQSSSVRGSTVLFFAAGLAAGMAHLHRLNAFFMIAPFLTYLIYQRRVRKQYAWILVGGMLIVTLEMSYWTYHAREPLYRIGAVAKGESGGSQRATARGMISEDESALTRWIPRPGKIRRGSPETHLIEPLLMFSTNQEFGLLFFFALPAVLYSAYRRDRGSVLAMWVIVLALMLAYFPVQYPFCMVRNPRYYTCLSVPTVVLVASWLLTMRPAIASVLTAALLSSSLLCIMVDSSRFAMDPISEVIRIANDNSDLAICTSPNHRIAAFVLSNNTADRYRTHLFDTNSTSNNVTDCKLLFPNSEFITTPQEIPDGLFVVSGGNEDPSLRVELGGRGRLIARIEPQRNDAIAYLLGYAERLGLPPRFVSRLMSGEGQTVEVWRIWKNGNPSTPAVREASPR